MDDIGGDKGTASESPSDADRTLSPDVLELDHVFQALAHPRRRYLCYTLLEEAGWSLTDLATKIAAWENDVSEHAVTDDQRRKVYVALYHSHVPKLVDEGVVEFDPATEEIHTGENASQVLAALSGMGSTLDATQESHARGDINEGTE